VRGFFFPSNTTHESFYVGLGIQRGIFSRHHEDGSDATAPLPCPARLSTTPLSHGEATAGDGIARVPGAVRGTGAAGGRQGLAVCHATDEDALTPPHPISRLNSGGILAHAPPSLVWRTYLAGLDWRSWLPVDIDRLRAWIGSPSMASKASGKSLPSPACLHSSAATKLDRALDGWGRM
jgi:hypothetical protein